MKRLLILAVLTAAALICTLPQARAQQASQNVPQQAPFGDGEELSYTVSYSGLFNVMRVNLRTIGTTLNGRPHYHIVGNGRTTGLAKGIFNLNDTYHSWLDAATLLPSRMTSDLNEDNYRFRATYTYDWSTLTVNTVSRNAKWDADRYASFPITENSGDALSLLYSLRAIDVDTLEPGRRYPLQLVLDNGSKTIYYTCLGKENLKVKKIGTFRAIKIKCTMATSDGSTYEEGMELTAWISDDDNHIPLYIESPIRVGSVRVTLTAMNVVHPLTSLMK